MVPISEESVSIHKFIVLLDIENLFEYNMVRNPNYIPCLSIWLGFLIYKKARE